MVGLLFVGGGFRAVVGGGRGLGCCILDFSALQVLDGILYGPGNATQANANTLGMNTNGIAVGYITNET